jgi:hypothetical protein
LDFDLSTSSAIGQGLVEVMGPLRAVEKSLISRFLIYPNHHGSSIDAWVSSKILVAIAKTLSEHPDDG